MELRKLISKFLTSLVEKNYAQANDDLKKVVEEKVKQRVKASSDKLNRQKKLSDSKKEPYKRNKFKNDDNINEGLCSETDNEDSPKLSKKEKFLAMIAKKKNGKGSKGKKDAKNTKDASKKKKNSKKGNK
jgi:hypothetical protein